MRVPLFAQTRLRKTSPHLFVCLPIYLPSFLRRGGGRKTKSDHRAVPSSHPPSCWSQTSWNIARARQTHTADRQDGPKNQLLEEETAKNSAINIIRRPRAPLHHNTATNQKMRLESIHDHPLPKPKLKRNGMERRGC